MHGAECADALQMKYNKAFYAGSSNMCTVINTAPSASTLNGAGREQGNHSDDARSW